ncbi:MAG: MFS transporter [SAR324 cluster bacterium]|nr:MFS transporter [SAR324 cluster bacterium]
MFPVLNNRWSVLALMFLIGIAVPMQFQAVPAVAPFLVEEAGLSYTQIGLLTGLFMFPGILLALPVGLLGVRFGDKNVMVAGLALMCAGSLLFAITDAYALMFLSRLLGGAGAVLLMVQRSKVITDWFAGKEISTAMAIIASSFGLGVGIAMATLPGLAAAVSWRSAVLADAALPALALIVLLALYRDPPEQESGAGTEKRKLWNINRAELVLSAVAGVAFSLFVTGYIVFMSYTPFLLAERGVSPVEAGFLVSLVALVSIGSVPLGGYLTDRSGKTNLFVVGGALGAAFACLMIPVFPPALPWIMLFGFLRGGCTGGILALPAQVLRPQSRGTGFGVFFTVYYAAMALIPPLAGSLLDVTGRPAASIWFGGALWLSIVLTLLIFRLLQRRWVPADLPGQPGRVTVRD